MELMIPGLLAGLALVMIYWLFARIPHRLLGRCGPSWIFRRFLLLRYPLTIFWTVLSGFSIAIIGSRPGWWRLAGFCLSLFVAGVVGYLWTLYHLRLAHVGEQATQVISERSPGLKLVEEDSDSSGQELVRIGRLPAWKVFLILVTMQAVGALAGLVVRASH